MAAVAPQHLFVQGAMDLHGGAKCTAPCFAQYRSVASGEWKYAMLLQGVPFLGPDLKSIPHACGYVICRVTGDVIPIRRFIPSSLKYGRVFVWNVLQ